MKTGLMMAAGALVCASVFGMVVGNAVMVDPFWLIFAEGDANYSALDVALGVVSVLAGAPRWRKPCPLQISRPRAC